MDCALIWFRKSQIQNPPNQHAIKFPSLFRDISRNYTLNKRNEIVTVSKMLLNVITRITR